MPRPESSVRIVSRGERSGRGVEGSDNGHWKVFMQTISLDATGRSCPNFSARIGSVLPSSSPSVAWLAVGLRMFIDVPWLVAICSS